jgi:hypothetical protein
MGKFYKFIFGRKTRIDFRLIINSSQIKQRKDWGFFGKLIGLIFFDLKHLS